MHWCSEHDPFFHTGLPQWDIVDAEIKIPVENLELTSRFPQWVPTENKYVPKGVSLGIDR